MTGTSASRHLDIYISFLSLGRPASGTATYVILTACSNLQKLIFAARVIVNNHIGGLAAIKASRIRATRPPPSLAEFLSPRFRLATKQVFGDPNVRSTISPHTPSLLKHQRLHGSYWRSQNSSYYCCHVCITRRWETPISSTANIRDRGV
jgi:hypothetical protein